MKNIVKILCILIAIYSIYFPLSYFNKNADKKEIKISHILVETEEDSFRIKKEIEEGKKFEKAAEEYSICTSKEDGGNIGYNTRDGRLLPEFEEEAFNLPLRKVSNPVKTESGWHLIKIYDISYFSDRKNFDERYFYM